MDLATGHIVERYKVESVLGHGGMAVVYKVQHQKLMTFHALKVLNIAGAELGERLGHAPDGCSLYLGAALFELPLLLCEVLVLGRRVRAINLPNPELDELRRATSAVGQRMGVELPRIETLSLSDLPQASCDHGWIVSVLTDPECFPAQPQSVSRTLGGRRRLRPHLPASGNSVWSDVGPV